jgi:hypothetical protein
MEYKHKEALEREKEPWLQEHETKTNIIDQMFIQITHMKFVVQQRNSIDRRQKKRRSR